ncbi:hypothetical protein J1N35_041279 [Gossypium stocksii]|uniref:Putative plant transposon protein domain-containing protein n=1 Tax=Gossypium stocksii TaxID=47602 RepID=A0A9D3ZJA0_9ROSI|nr:hypothetical protein J1N35_041279 [Gossypium stocksii]
MPRKRTCASAQLDESQNKFHCEEAKARYESIFKNQQTHLEKGFTLKASNYIDFMACIRHVTKTLNWELFCKKRPSVDEDLVREFYANLTSKIHTCRREYLKPFAKVWFYFIRFSLMPSSHGSTISLEQMVLLYLILTGKTIDVGKIILREMQNCAVRRSGLAYFPFTITILCLKAKFFVDVKKTGYSQDIITDWDLYRIARYFVLQQQGEESDDPKEEEDPTEIEPLQSVETPNKAKPMEPEAEPDVTTTMFKTQSLCPYLRDELSKLMDIMQHIQWQQQAY